VVAVDVATGVAKFKTIAMHLQDEALTLDRWNGAAIIPAPIGAF
jgi:hypothetical protein